MEFKLPWFLKAESQKVYINPQSTYLVLDFETTSIGFGSALEPENDLLLACWYHSVEGRGSCEGGEYNQQELVRLVNSVDFIVAHNAKFELQWLARCGVELRDVLAYDTMLGEWVLQGNVKYAKDLNSLAKRYRLPKGKEDVVASLIKLGVDPKYLPPAWLKEYCHQDVAVTHEVFKKQVRLLEERNQLHLVHLRNLTASVLADIETEGMTLDAERVTDEYEKVSEALAECDAQLREISEGANLRSGKQLRELLYGRLGFAPPRDSRGNIITTPGGDAATSSDVLNKLVSRSDKQRNFLDAYKRFNKLSSLLSKNLEFFRNVCVERDGVFHGALVQGVTATHRLAASGRAIQFKSAKKEMRVQFQNLPREYKKLFWSGDKDWLIAECDGAQLEFRTAAELAKDPVAIEEIENGVDVHSITAEVLCDAGQETSRQDAKASTFAPLYGGMGRTPAEKAYCEFFREKYSGISSTQRGWALKVVADKELRTPMGMVYTWKDTKVKASGYIVNSTSIYNYPIQGTATAEVIPIALVHFWHRIRGRRIRVFNTIHDSIIARVHREEVEDYELIAKLSLTYDVFRFLREVYGYNWDSVPLGVGIKVARNWGEAKVEVAYDVWPDGRETRKEKS